MRSPKISALAAALFLTGLAHYVHAQCTILANAVPGITLVHQNTNCLNNSGVAYNPGLNLYYACRAGNATFPYETWTGTGVPLYNTTTGNDFRGLWWNPTLGSLEGNSYNSAGIWKTNLNASGYALNTGSIVLASGQPNAQSCGDLDWQAYEILYYSAGAVYRYSRTTGAFIASYPLTGTPVAFASLNSTTLMYTGCTGKEIALLDYVNKRVYLYNKATGAYQGSCQLPAAAVVTAQFRCSWANNLLWLFNVANFTWYSYQVITAPLPVTLTAFSGACNNGVITLDWSTSSETDNDYFTVERTKDGSNFEIVGTVDGGGTTTQPDHYSFAVTEFTEGAFYYRLKQTDYDGAFTYSELIHVGCATDSSRITVLPNPAADLCFVDGCKMNDVVSLFDAAGRKVYEQIILAEGRHEIPLADLAPGVYHLKVSSADRVHDEPLLIQR